MKTTTAFSLLAAVSLAFSSAAFAGTKDYQVTGPILDVNDSMIAVQKGKDRWEIARDANTKASGEMKVGDKVTVHYTMTATDIEAKPAKAEKSAKKEEKKKE
jgi:ribosomal protein S1